MGLLKDNDVVVRNFKSKNNFARLITAWQFFGIGILFDCKRPEMNRVIRFTFSFDLIFIRFWWDNYKPLKPGELTFEEKINSQIY